MWKKKKKKTRYNKEEALICSAQNGSEWESLFPTFGREVFFCRYKGKDISNRAKTFAITKTKEPDEIARMCLNSNVSEFPSGQTG